MNRMQSKALARFFNRCPKHVAQDLGRRSKRILSQVAPAQNQPATFRATGGTYCEE
jgi:hypothetical protein